ncbi:protein farnesyltransferase/geranylgeranyltransferase type-1 subunit alpha [Onthophagus taurus]|uniref:protein farnesyltransferase/geranylgeranyltransferase type-1 subunit alpha n=1 Tax=Onthophagus taurus TaxID=166361 RepID=UPI000C2022C3|nr:protein farnesyltransferase/geranylgeranyltransferase type-1 subunit alpha [Onthophagus taurus]
MSDSSEEEVETMKFVFYRDRPEWKDVEPIPQYDGEDPVVSIAYSEEFVDVYNYLRAIMKMEEKSERALELTEDAVRLNPANYTVWQYRRVILKALNKDLKGELAYIERIIKGNMKNYQVWHHRKVLIEWLNDGSQELNFTKKILEEDEKNYHAWQHRQWAIKTFNLYENELEYIDSLLDTDIRNNSAWNQRYFIVNNTTGFTEDVLKREIAYSLNKIRIVTENESAWNYLRGLLLHDKAGLSKNGDVVTFCHDLYASGNRSPFLLALLVDMYDEQVSKEAGDCAVAMEKGVSLCKDLAEKYDTIRCTYWNYMATMIENKLKINEETPGTSAN